MVDASGPLEEMVLPKLPPHATRIRRDGNRQQPTCSSSSSSLFFYLQFVRGINLSNCETVRQNFARFRRHLKGSHWVSLANTKGFASTLRRHQYGYVDTVTFGR